MVWASPGGSCVASLRPAVQVLRREREPAAPSAGRPRPRTAARRRRSQPCLSCSRAASRVRPRDSRNSAWAFQSPASSGGISSGAPRAAPAAGALGPRAALGASGPLAPLPALGALGAFASTPAGRSAGPGRRPRERCPRSRRLAARTGDGRRPAAAKAVSARSCSPTAAHARPTRKSTSLYARAGVIGRRAGWRGAARLARCRRRASAGAAGAGPASASAPGSAGRGRRLGCRGLRRRSSPRRCRETRPLAREERLSEAACSAPPGDRRRVRRPPPGRPAPPGPARAWSAAPPGRAW